MKAYQLLSKPKTWIKFYLSEDKDGGYTTPDSPEAVKFCVLGALDKCYGSFNSQPQIAKLAKLIDPDLPNYMEHNLRIRQMVADWNNAKSRTKKQVVSALKKLDI